MKLSYQARWDDIAINADAWEETHGLTEITQFDVDVQNGRYHLWWREKMDIIAASAEDPAHFDLGGEG